MAKEKLTESPWNKIARQYHGQIWENSLGPHEMSYDSLPDLYNAVSTVVSQDRREELTEFQ